MNSSRRVFIYLPINNINNKDRYIVPLFQKRRVFHENFRERETSTMEQV